MDIHGIYHVANTDAQKFTDDVSANINLLQADGQEVEVQYQMQTFPGGQVVYGALITGRK